MKQNEVLNLMRNLVNRENALIRLDESDVKYLTEEKEVEVISSFSLYARHEYQLTGASP